LVERNQAAVMNVMHHVTAFWSRPDAGWTGQPQIGTADARETGSQTLTSTNGGLSEWDRWADTGAAGEGGGAYALVGRCAREVPCVPA
jgi:hypothetical protein